jgi:transposase
MASLALVGVRESGMRSKTFRPYDQDSLLLMPPSVRDWVPSDGLAAFINDAVEALDLAPFLAAHHEPRGMPSYHPALMLKVLLYGYATGITSSRKLEARLASDVGFMYLAGQSRPDHKTISSFRRRHLAALAERGIDAYIAVGRDHHGVSAPAAPRGRIPAGLSRRQRMSRKLRTKAGRRHYARRKVIVEPVFGQIKEARGFRRFGLRGLEAVRAEWLLVAAVHNLGKLFTSGRVGRVLSRQPIGSGSALVGAFA